MSSFEKLREKIIDIEKDSDHKGYYYKIRFACVDKSYILTISI